VDRLDPLLVAVGGAVGALARYGIDLLVSHPFAPATAGTLVVNVLGSVALGALVTVAPDRRTQVFLGTGLLSSFTTYSTFAVETAGLDPVAATAYVGATYAFGVAAAVAGRLLAGRVVAS
jgi:CrcB protein